MNRKKVVQDNQFGIIPRDVAYAPISVMAKAVYMVLAQFGQAFPSHRFIADRLGVSVSTVKRALKQLIDTGYVSVEARQGDNGGQTSNLYHLGSMTYTPPVASDPPPVHSRPTPQVISDLPPGSPVSDYVVQEEGDKKKVTTDVVTRARETFDDFWAIYPRRAGKEAAKRAWDSATKRAFPAVILAGARRFRDDPNREPSFTCHPSTWLNQGRWDDDPLPPRESAPPRKIGRGEQNLIEYQRLFGDEDEPQGSISTLDRGIDGGWTDRFGSVGRSVG